MFTKTVVFDNTEYTFPLLTLQKYLAIAATRDDNNQEAFKHLLIEALNQVTPTPVGKTTCEYLLIRILESSISQSSPKILYKCKDCGKTHVIPINFNTITTTHQKQYEYVIKGIKIVFNEPAIFNDDNVAKTLITSISHIETKDETIAFNDMSDDEIASLFSIISEDDIVKIKTMLLEPKMHLIIPVKCECGSTHQETYSGFKEIVELT